MALTTSARGAGGSAAGGGGGPGPELLGQPGQPPVVRRSPLAELLERPLASYYLVLASASMLLALGLVMVLSASAVESYQESGSSFSVFSRQLLWCAVGVPLMFLASRTPIRVIRWSAWPALLGTAAMLAAVQVPGIGVEVNGNRNWIEFGGPFRLQPSELAKLALAVWGAHVLAAKARLLDQWRHLLVPLLPAAALVLGLVLYGHDLGTVLVLGTIVATLLYVAGAPMRLFVGGLAVVSVGLAALVVTTPHRMSRIMAFLDPSGADPTGVGYQLLHGKYALGSGGWFGLGLGASRQKWGLLPEQQTDFIFAIVGEELGLVGTTAVLGMLTVLGYAGLRIALRTRDLFVRLAAGAVTGWLMVQSIINIGAVLGVLPIIGLPLPLLSYGGSALLPTLLALGLLLAFARAEEGAALALAARGSLWASLRDRVGGPFGRGAAGRLRGTRRPARRRVPVPHLPRRARR